MQSFIERCIVYVVGAVSSATQEIESLFSLVLFCMLCFAKDITKLRGWKIENFYRQACVYLSSFNVQKMNENACKNKIIHDIVLFVKQAKRKGSSVTFMRIPRHSDIHSNAKTD